MNAVGRQGQRSNNNNTHHHQRQLSDNYLDMTSSSTTTSSSNGRWLQSTGLQHLQQPNTNPNSSSDFGYGGSRMYSNSNNRNGGNVGGAQRSLSGGGNDLFNEPLTPPGRQKKQGGSEEPNGFSPGLLDLHSFDTELISEMPVTTNYGAPMYNNAQGRSFDDAELYFGNTKQTSKARGLPDNNLMKSFAPEKEKASSVAKIKVVVRKRPLNKKELAKNEEDIVTTETQSSCLTVHETKLKVDLTEYMEKHEFVFDAVLNEEVSNDEVYRETVEPIVPIIFQRTKATCFAYGQTGSGKTFTMKPLPLKASRDILRLVNHTYRSQGFQLYFSFFEIYGGKLYDLLSDRKVKSLSKGNKKDTLSSTFNSKESAAVSMSTSVLPRVSSYEDSMLDSYPEQADEDDYDTTEEFYEPEQPSWKNNTKVESYSFSNALDKNRRINGQTKSKEPPRSESRNWSPDDELNALLKEEEDLVNAHRKQVEDTMDIVRVEMNLLVEADEPGNQLDDYVAKLNTILAQKAAAIAQLQNRLAHFQKRLREHDVLISSGH
ncbi:ATP binding microtubule motor family protein [Artemisia annua]|uniref:ATP binding microtubule motor family protein n=1 Tax=Artemisia annua TaxID=35608 RepID=A0A2U1Q2A6_ARTAN|nr:ATP binding microtubule motor family protein [Artemisia annua]